jgi:hypothetical protein
MKATKLDKKIAISKRKKIKGYGQIQLTNATALLNLPLR